MKESSRGDCKISSPHLRYNCNWEGLRVFIYNLALTFALAKKIRTQKLGEAELSGMFTGMPEAYDLTLRAFNPTQRRLKTNLKGGNNRLFMNPKGAISKQRTIRYTHLLRKLREEAGWNGTTAGCRKKNMTVIFKLLPKQERARIFTPN